VNGEWKSGYKAGDRWTDQLPSSSKFDNWPYAVKLSNGKWGYLNGTLASS
jgi:hypothetical protein